MKLTARFCETANKPGRYGDGRGGYGLALYVKAGAEGGVTRSWVQRIRINGRETNIGLGRYPLVTLARARKAALDNARTIMDGGDPRQRSAGVPSFADAAEKVIDMHAKGWRDGGKSERQWRASLATYALPGIGGKAVDAITTGDVLAIVAPLYAAKHETGRRVKQRISTVMRWAIAEGYRADDPAGPALAAALPKNGNGKHKQHHRALPYSEVAGALAKVRASKAWPATKLAFEFLTLTAARSGEVRGARWDEIDPDGAVWTVPGERMKAGRDHRVPLSPRALAILREAAALADGSGIVFPSVRGKALSDMTLSKLAGELGLGCVPHGMRSSFRQWAAERSNAPREVAELALAHVNQDRVEAAYQRSDLFELRRNLMNSWADYLG